MLDEIPSIRDKSVQIKSFMIIGLLSPLSTSFDIYKGISISRKLSRVTKMGARIAKNLYCFVYLAINLSINPPFFSVV